MNPQEQIKQLEKKVDDMIRGQNLELNRNLKRYILQAVLEFGAVTSADDNNQQTVVLDSDATTELAEIDAPNSFDKRVAVVLNGTTYYIGLYT